MARAWLIAALAATVLAGCGGDEASKPAPPAPDRMTVTSSAFTDNGAIPERYSCDGRDVSPPLAWRGVPAGAKQLALIVQDPDAPSGPFVHWLLYGIRPSVHELAEGETPPGVRQGRNSKGDSGYAGPCPPGGDDPHHYVFTLYALSRPLDLPDGAAADDVIRAVGAAATARGRLVGLFGR